MGTGYIEIHRTLNKDRYPVMSVTCENWPYYLYRVYNRTKKKHIGDFKISGGIGRRLSTEGRYWGGGGKL